MARGLRDAAPRAGADYRCRQRWRDEGNGVGAPGCASRGLISNPSLSSVVRSQALVKAAKGPQMRDYQWAIYRHVIRFHEKMALRLRGRPEGLLHQMLADHYRRLV